MAHVTKIAKTYIWPHCFTVRLKSRYRHSGTWPRMLCLGYCKSSGKRSSEIPVNFPLFDWAAYTFNTAIWIEPSFFQQKSQHKKGNALQTQSFQIAARCISGALCDLPEPHDLRRETQKVGTLRIFPAINWMYHEDLLYWASGRPI